MMHILYISNKSVESDFRLPIVTEITRTEYCRFFIVNRKENNWQLTEVANGVLIKKTEVANFPSMREVQELTSVINLVFDSTGATRLYEVLQFSINFKCPVLLDYFDNLKYDLKGFAKAKREIELILYKFASDIVLYLSPRLYIESQSVLCKSYLIDNYRNVESPLEYISDINLKPNIGVLLGNIDSRIDYKFIENLLQSRLSCIEVFGRFLNLDAEDKFKSFSKLNANKIIYKGPYLQNHATTIIKDYSVGILPYNDKILRLFGVRPDKLNTYLSVGLDVITAGKYGLDGFYFGEEIHFEHGNAYIISGKSPINQFGPLSKMNIAFQFNTIISILNAHNYRMLRKAFVYVLYTIKQAVKNKFR